MRKLLKITRVLRDPITKRMTGVDETVFEDGDLVAKSSTGIYHEIPIVSVVEKTQRSDRELTPEEELEDAENCNAHPDFVAQLRGKVSTVTLDELDQDA